MGPKSHWERIYRTKQGGWPPGARCKEGSVYPDWPHDGDPCYVLYACGDAPPSWR